MVGVANRLTVRGESDVKVMASEEGFVEKGLAELRARTEQFLQVLLQPKLLQHKNRMIVGQAASWSEAGPLLGDGDSALHLPP